MLLTYFSTLLIAALALIAVWLVWNYYMQSPWTRDGKIRAEPVSITPQVSGGIPELNVRDNQQVKAGDVLFRLDQTPFKIAVMNALAQQAKAQSDMAKAVSDGDRVQSGMARARHQAERRRDLPKNFISAEDLDTVNMALQAATANVEAAKASVSPAWMLPALRWSTPAGSSRRPSSKPRSMDGLPTCPRVQAITPPQGARSLR